MLEIEPRVLYMANKHSTAQQHSQLVVKKYTPCFMFM